jgi:manganese transport protein
MAGQIVMEGFISWKIPATYRRVITRALAIVPAMVVIVIGGQGASNNLLLTSQVVLSFALPFAVFPLIHLTSDVNIMGSEFVNRDIETYLAYLFGGVICVLNVTLIYLTFQGWAGTP